MPVTIHHAHGGSMKLRGIHKGARQKTSDWLVIPVCGYHHFGQQAIDGPIGVIRWEQMYGEQAAMLDSLCVTCGLDLWELAKEIQRKPREISSTRSPSNIFKRTAA